MESFNQFEFIKHIYECEKYKHLLEKRRQEINEVVANEIKGRDFIPINKNEEEYQNELKSKLIDIPEKPKKPKKPNAPKDYDSDFLGSVFLTLVVGGIIGLVVDILIKSIFHPDLHFTVPGWIVMFIIFVFLTIIYPIYRESSDKRLHEWEIERYNKEIERYNKDLELYKKVINDNKKITKNFEAEYNDRIAEENRLAEYQCKKDNQDKIDDFNNSPKGLVLFSEAEKIEDSLSRVNQTLENLYEHRENGVLCLHPNYKGFIPISVIYGYFDTGRCSTLAGADGAYNLYEDEKYKGLVISNLSNINAQLGNLNSTMFYVGQTLVSINNQINTLNQTAFRMIDSLNGINSSIVSSADNIDAKLSELGKSMNNQSDLLKQINDKSQNIEFYEKTNARINAVNAMYSNNLDRLSLNTKMNQLHDYDLF